MLAAAQVAILLFVLLPFALAANTVKLEDFAVYRRGDGYSVARFVLVNDTDTPITAVELFCRDTNAKASAKVMVQPPSPIAPHSRYAFDKINIGLVSKNPKMLCDVTKVE